ncbi:hypothetical protein [Hymenobacter aquaticus]|nr:hypothetical protein [Hymenobacter aquaticus]
MRLFLSLFSATLLLAGCQKESDSASPLLTSATFEAQVQSRN